MSPVSVRRLLWVVLMVALPVPMLGLESGWVPVIRLLLLGGATAGIALQGPDDLSLLFTGMFLGQAVLWGLLQWWVARAIVRRLPSFAPFALVGALLVAALFPIYETPYSADHAASSILQILE